MIVEARLKSTLRYLNFENYQVGRVHELWSSAKYNQLSVYRSFVHVKISVGTFILQSSKARLAHRGPTGVFFFCSGVSKLFGAHGSPSSGSLLNLLSPRF